MLPAPPHSESPKSSVAIMLARVKRPILLMNLDVKTGAALSQANNPKLLLSPPANAELNDIIPKCD